MAKAIQFVKSHAPEALIPHSYAGASVAAWVMYQKYGNSMPLYRQEQDWNRMGVQPWQTGLSIVHPSILHRFMTICTGNC